MNDLKIGDYVRLVKYPNQKFYSMIANIGAIGRVYKIDEEWVYIKWLSNQKTQNDGGYFKEIFKIIDDYDEVMVELL